MPDEQYTADPRRLRASDAEREQVAELLARAMAQGMLEVEELDTRSARARDAKTLGELEAITADLPLAASPGSGERPSAALTGTDDVVELRGTLSSLKRQGDWRVPRRLVLRRRLGSVELDFSDAEIAYPVVEIELDIAGGSVEMRLPEGAGASIDDVAVTLGSVEDRRKYARHTGKPTFLITGDIRWGSLELRGPRRRLLGRRH
jgi:hypothetical protein